jgi:hypothetical protein
MWGICIRPAWPHATEISRYNFGHSGERRLVQQQQPTIFYYCSKTAAAVFPIVSYDTLGCWYALLTSSGRLCTVERWDQLKSVHYWMDRHRCPWSRNAVHITSKNGNFTEELWHGSGAGRQSPTRDFFQWEERKTKIRQNIIPTRYSIYRKSKWARM